MTLLAVKAVNQYFFIGSSEEEEEASEMDLLLPKRKTSTRELTPTKRKYLSDQFKNEASPPEKEALHFDKSDFDPGKEK